MSKAVQERFFQESCARIFFYQRDVKSCAREILSREFCKSVCFAREMSKAVQEKFFQESCARVIFFCQRDVQGCTRFIVVLIVAQKRDSHIFVSSEHS
jgi:hypothetical protein